jgi:predicted acyl esterase
LKSVKERHFKGDITFWNEVLAHPTRGGWWKARDERPHYRDAKPAVLVVGGLYDAEDLRGTVATYQAFNAQSPGADVRLVLGPWLHGGWARTDGDALGDVSFGSLARRRLRTWPRPSWRTSPTPCLALARPRDLGPVLVSRFLSPRVCT